MKWYHCGVPLPKATAGAPRRMVTAVADAAAGNGFSSTCAEKAADDLNYTLGSWRYTETTRIFKALNNPDRKGGGRHQLPCYCPPRGPSRVPVKGTLMWAWATAHLLHCSGSKMSLSWKWNKKHGPSHPEACCHKELNSFVWTVESYDHKLLHKPTALTEKISHFIRSEAPWMVWHGSICTTKRKMWQIKLWHIINFKMQPYFVDGKNVHFKVGEIWDYRSTQTGFSMLKSPFVQFLFFQGLSYASWPNSNLQSTFFIPPSWTPTPCPSLSTL